MLGALLSCEARAAGPDYPGGLDLAVDIAPFGLFEFEEAIAPSAGVSGAVEIGDGLGLGALYRGLGDFGGMAGAFGRIATTPELVQGKPFAFVFADVGAVAGLGGLSGAALYAHGQGAVGYATSPNVGFTAALGLTAFMGVSATSVSSIQIPVASIGLVYRAPKK